MYITLMILRLRFRLAPLGDDTWSMTSPGAMAGGGAETTSPFKTGVSRWWPARSAPLGPDLASGGAQPSTSTTANGSLIRAAGGGAGTTRRCYRGRSAGSRPPGAGSGAALSHLACHPKSRETSRQGTCVLLVHAGGQRFPRLGGERPAAGAWLPTPAAGWQPWSCPWVRACGRPSVGQPSDFAATVSWVKTLPG